MRRLVWMVFVGLAVAGPDVASADVTTSVETKSYPVSGATGAALLDVMDRRGPRHGFRARAIAQTRYSVSWRIEWAQTSTACRVRRVDGKLAITYTYPKLESAVSSPLKRRWAAFLSGVTAHEEQHGVMARQMARAAEKAALDVKVVGDRNCRKAKAEVKRRMAAVYDDYERRQNRFDQREHRPGGPVEGLVERLAR
jgi:predicted secreted Zn-dependent protease